MLDSSVSDRGASPAYISLIGAPQKNFRNIFSPGVSKTSSPARVSRAWPAGLGQQGLASRAWPAGLGDWPVQPPSADRTDRGQRGRLRRGKGASGAGEVGEGEFPLPHWGLRPSKPGLT